MASAQTMNNWIIKTQKAFSIAVAFTIVTAVDAVLIASPARADRDEQLLPTLRSHWRVIDKTGKFVFDRQFERMPEIQDHDILGSEFSISNRRESDLVYFSFDLAGKRKRALSPGPPNYEDGLAWGDLTSFKEDGLFGFQDSNGRKVIAAKFKGVGAFHGDYAIATFADRLAVIDKTGVEVWNSKNNRPTFNDKGVGVVQVGDQYFGFNISSNRGQTFGSFIGWFEGDEIFVAIATPVIGPNGELGGPNPGAKSGIALKRDGSYCAANPEDVLYFSEGLARVKRGDHFEYVDRAGNSKIVLPSNTHSAGLFKEGRAVVTLDLSPPEAMQTSVHGQRDQQNVIRPGPFLSGVIDTTGAFVVPPKYSKIGSCFEDGLLMVGNGEDLDARCGYVDTSGSFVISPTFQYGTDFHKGLAAVFVASEAAVEKNKADQQYKRDYQALCIASLTKALKTFFSEGDMRISVSQYDPSAVTLQKWSGPSKLRPELLKALKEVQIPPLPKLYRGNENPLELCASKSTGLVVAESSNDPFNAIRSEVIRIQKLYENAPGDNVSTEKLEEKWRVMRAYYDWNNSVLPSYFDSLAARYKETKQTAKLRTLTAVAADLQSGTLVDRRQYIFSLIWTGDKEYLIGNKKAAEFNYKKAAALFDDLIVEVPEDYWPPMELRALYTYACFLAVEKRWKESNLLFEKALVFALNDGGLIHGNSASEDGFDTYLELIRTAQPLKYASYLKDVKKARLPVMHSTGFIDTNGAVVIPPDFVQSKPFSEGLAAVETVRGWGYLDKTGNWKIEPQYREAYSFSGGLAAVRDPKILFPLEHRTENPKYFFISTSGKKAIAEEFESALPFSNGFASVKSSGEKDPHVIDQTGTTVTLDGCTDIYELSQDQFLFSKLVPVAEGLSDQYFIRKFLSKPDSSGRRTFIADDLNPVAVLDDKQKLLFGYFDANGGMILKPQFHHAKPFFEGLASVVLESGKHGCIDKAGKFVIPAVYDSAEFFHNGQVWVSKDSKSFLINQKNERISPEYSRIEHIQGGLFDVVAYQGDQKFLYSGPAQGLDVSQYTQVKAFKDGRAAVSKDNLSGFIDQTGKVVIPIQYRSVEDFSEGLAAVSFR